MQNARVHRSERCASRPIGEPKGRAVADHTLRSSARGAELPRRGRSDPSSGPGEKLSSKNHARNRITALRESSDRIATVNFDTRAASWREPFWCRRSPAAPVLAGSRPPSRLRSIRARLPRGLSGFRNAAPLRCRQRPIWPARCPRETGRFPSVACNVAPAAPPPRPGHQLMSRPEGRSPEAMGSCQLISLDARFLAARPKC